MKTIFNYVLAALGYIFLCLVLSILFYVFGNGEESFEKFMVSFFMAIIATIVIRYFIKYKLKKKTPVPAPKPRADNAQTTQALAIIDEIKSSDNPYETYKQKDKELKRLKAGGADVTDDDFYVIMRTVALDFANRREMPPEEWSQQITSACPIVFQRNEAAIFFAPYKSGTTYKTERKYVAGNRGVGIRVAKGVSFRVGRIAGKSISESVPVDIGKGALVVTNKSLYYFDNGVAKKLALSKIVGVQSSEQYLDIMPDGARAQPIEFCLDSEETASVMQVLIKTQW